MDFLLDALTNWLKEMLVGGIMGNLTGMFDSVMTLPITVSLPRLLPKKVFSLRMNFDTPKPV